MLGSDWLICVKGNLWSFGGGFLLFFFFQYAFVFFLFISGVLQAQSGDECVLSECHTGNTLVMSVSVMRMSDCHIGNEYFMSEHYTGNACVILECWRNNLMQLFVCLCMVVVGC